MIIRKKFTFDASHQLPDYDGPCVRLHGHSWTLWVSVTGILNTKTGMVIDFKDIKKIVSELIVNQFDHSHLNDIIPNPTAENLTLLIRKTLAPAFTEYGVNLASITLAETEGNEVIC